MSVLIWTGVFLGLYVFILLNTLSGPRLATESLYIRAAEDDPRIPASANKYFAFVREQVTPLGFVEVVRFIQPGAFKGMTAYAVVYANECGKDTALALVAVRPMIPGSFTGSVFEFSTEFYDEFELNTNNSRSPIRPSRPLKTRIQQIPDMADLATLYSVHRDSVDRMGQAPVRRTLDPDATLDRLRSGVKKSLAARVQSGRISLTPDGRHYRFSIKTRLRAILDHTWPGSYFVSTRMRRTTRRKLRELGLGEDYELQSTRFPTTSPSARKVVVVGKLIIIGVFTMIAGTSFYGFQGGTATRRFVGIGLAVGLLWIPWILRRMKPKAVDSFFCSNCGYTLKGKNVICSLCGEGACSQCGYNLFGNLSGVCPECGTAIIVEEVA